MNRNVSLCCSLSNMLCFFPDPKHRLLLTRDSAEGSVQYTDDDEVMILCGLDEEPALGELAWVDNLTFFDKRPVDPCSEKYFAPSMPFVMGYLGDVASLFAHANFEGDTYYARYLALRDFCTGVALADNVSTFICLVRSILTHCVDTTWEVSLRRFLTLEKWAEIEFPFFRRQGNCEWSAASFTVFLLNLFEREIDFGVPDRNSRGLLRLKWADVEISRMYAYSAAMLRRRGIEAAVIAGQLLPLDVLRDRARELNRKRNLAV